MKLILTKQSKDKIYDVDYIATHTEVGKMVVKVKNGKVLIIEAKDWDKILLERERERE